MTGWPEVPLGAVVELKRGYDLPRGQRREGSVPIVSSSGVSGSHDVAKVPGPGVVTGRYGTLGLVFYVDRDFWPLNTSLYVRDFKGNDPRYVAALLTSMDLAQYEGAAAVPGLNRNQLHTVPVPSAPPAAQRAIADVLQTIDDLLAVDRRRVEVLEDLARTMYREWFVHLRFPGHEDATFVDSTAGPIPAGWEATRLDRLASLTMGQSPKSEHYNEVGDGLPFHQGVKDFGPRFPRHRQFCSVPGRQAAEGDVLVSVRAPVGRMNIAPGEMTIGRGLAAVRSRAGHQALLWERLRQGPFAAEDAMGGGTIFKAIGKDELASLPLLRATDDIEGRADAVLSDLSDEVRRTTRRIERLTALRDLLLPRLVSGRIDVSDLDLDRLVDEAPAG